MSDVGQVIGTAIGGIIGFALGGPAGAVKGAVLGYSLTAPNPGESPTYSFGTQCNTASQTIPVPVVYGRNLIAGNTIFKKVSGENNKKMAIQVAVSEGPIQSITSIKANDVDITSKCRVKLGERTQSADSINDQGQTFPYTAYISVELTADEEISGNPTITSIVEGRKVEIWDGSQWVVQYSQNPAYCLLDFLTNKRHGLGISKDDIDLDSFITVAEYCDELVDGEPRFQLDYVVDYQKSSLDHIQDILATFRGFLIYSAGEFRLKVDGPETEVQSFTTDNIVADSFSYWKTSRKERYNRVVVEYIAPDEHWQKIGAQYSIDSDIQKRGLVDTTIPLLGINRFSQAGRMAKYFQKNSWYNTTFCQFKVGIDSLHCESGDVVKVSHDVPGWNEKLFRILEISEEENDEMTLICQEYNVAVYSDDGVVQQVKKDSDLPNPFEAPASVTNLSLIEEAEVLGDGTWVPRFRASWTRPDYIVWQAGNIYISNDNGATWDFIAKVEGEEYIIPKVAPATYRVKVVSESKKGRKEDFGLAATGQITVHGKDAPPSDVNWGRCDFDERIILRWQPVNDIDLKAYESRTDTNFGNDDAGLIYRGDGLSCTIDNPQQRTYTFYIKSLDRSGNYSSTANSITVSNPAPSTPPQPIVTEFFQALWIEIQPASDDDIEGYRVYITNKSTLNTEIIDVSTPQRITYKADPGTSFDIEVSAYDALGEGGKSNPVTATTAFVGDIDIPDELIQESKLAQDLQSKIDTAKTNSDNYANQIIAYPTEEDAALDDPNLNGTDYTMKYSSGDIYVGTDVETDPNAFFDLTDQNDGELVDANGDPITIIDVRDENGVTLLGTGKPTWYGEGTTEEIHLILSAAPSIGIRINYGVKKKLSQLAVDGLIKKGVTAKQVDANVVGAIEAMRGFAWNSPVPDDMKLINMESRITNNEGTLSTHQTSIQQNADNIQSNATRITTAEDNISANQTLIDQNADAISSNASRITTNENNIQINASNITQNADAIQQNVIAINTVDSKVNERSIAIPEGAILFHFDEHLQSTQQLEPESGYVATLRPGEGKFGGAVAVEEGTMNLVRTYSNADPFFTSLDGWTYSTSYFSAEIIDDKQSLYGGKVLKLVDVDGDTTTTVWPSISCAHVGTFNYGEYCSRKIRYKIEGLTTGSFGLWSHWYGYDSGGNLLYNIAKDLRLSGANTNGYVEAEGSWQVPDSVSYPDVAYWEKSLCIGSYKTNLNATIYVDAVQAEKKPFATSFVDGTRADGNLPYKINIPNPSAGFFRYYAPFEIRCTNAEPAGVAIPNTYLFELRDTNTSKHVEFRTYKDLPYIDPEVGQTGYEHIHQTWVPQANTWYGILWELDDDEFRVTAYDDNGNIIQTWVSVLTEYTSFTPNQISYNCFGGSAKIDEKLIMPGKLPTPEEIAAWYNSNAPFYDSRQVEIHQSQVTQLANEYTVKIQEHANGQKVVSGFGLALEGGVSEFGVLADRFKIYGNPDDPNETATPVFVLDTQANKLYLLADLIADGTITARMIGTNEIITNTANIKDAIIDDAKIINIEADKITTDRAKIQSAQIESIETSQIKVGGQPAQIINPKPPGAHLWHFDRSLISTDGLKPEPGYVATLRPNEGKFGGAVAVEEWTTNQFTNYNNGAFNGIVGNTCMPNQIGLNANVSSYTSVYDNGYNGTGVKATLTSNANGYAYLGYNQESVPASEFQEWTFQFKYKVLSGENYFWNVSCLQSFNIFGYLGSFGTRTIIDLGNGWKKCIISGTSLAGTTRVHANIRLGVKIASQTVQFIVDEAQLEHKSFATSFVDGTRANGKIVLNSNYIPREEGTIFVKVKPASTSNWVGYDYHVILSEMTSNENDCFYLWVRNNGLLQAELRDGVTLTTLSISNIDWTQDGWYTIALSYNSTEQKLYCWQPNGILLTSSHTGDFGKWTPKPTVIGSNTTNGNDWWDGFIDELLISPKAHTDEEIAAWYSSNAPFFDNESIIGAGRGVTIGSNGIIGNDGTKDTFKIDTDGNAYFEGVAKFAEGKVVANEEGITVNDGKMIVKNPSGVTIIDGSSNMFKIHQTGTATIAAKSAVTIPFPDLGYRPACLAYMLGTNSPVANQAILAYYIYYEENGAHSWGIWASTTTNSIRIENFYSHSLDVRYYVLKEEAI